ncbi:MAG: hypothetical protein GY939_15250, partial [Actinomycetia bacterium]|nr:hypothetical protein [Actinomycetes bacterium]
PRSLTGNYSEFSSEAIIRWTGPANTTGLSGFTIFADGEEQWTCPIASNDGICFDVTATGGSWIDISPNSGTTTYQIRSNGPMQGPPLDSEFSAPLLLVTS